MTDWDAWLQNDLEREYATWARDHGAIREDMANAWIARIEKDDEARHAALEASEHDEA